MAKDTPPEIQEVVERICAETGKRLRDIGDDMKDLQASLSPTLTPDEIIERYEARRALRKTGEGAPPS